MLSALIRINDYIIKVTKIITVAAFSVMVVASTAQVLFRFVLNLPLGWTEELSRYMFVWSTMLGTSIFIRKREHSSVDVLETYLPKKYRRSLYLLIDVLCLVFFVVMIAGGITVTKVAMDAVSPALNIPMGLVYISVPVSGLIMFSMTLENIIKSLKDRREASAQ